jgi:hypothetical protein
VVSRILALSPSGVANMKGKQIQWFVRAEDVYRITQSETNPKTFNITFFHHYSFDAETSEQASRVIDALKGLGLGQIHEKSAAATASEATNGGYLFLPSTPLSADGASVMVLTPCWFQSCACGHSDGRGAERAHRQRAEV